MSFLRRREVRVEHWVQDVSNLSCWDVLRKRRGLDVSIVSCWEDECGRQFISGWVLKSLH